MKEKQPTKKKLYEEFSITSVTRADLVSKDLISEEEAEEISDQKMETIAGKMADAYLDNGYWIDLKVIAKEVI